MKKTATLCSVAAILAAITLSAYQSSPATSGAGNRTGSPGSTANCSSGGCHSGSTANTTGTFTVTKPSAPTVPVTSYTPGTTYNVKFVGTNSNAKPKFGFQATVTDGAGATTGTINALMASHAVHGVGPVKIIEHTTPQAGPGGAYSVDFTWVAPSAGTGTVTFYGIFNAVNGDGSTGGDEPSFGITKALTESTASIDEKSFNATITIVPNPASNVISIKGINSGKGNIAIYSAAGAMVLQTSFSEQMDISSLAAGTYLLQLQQEGHISSTMFSKQ
jgi:hypothetical protein